LLLIVLSFFLGLLLGDCKCYSLILLFEKNIGLDDLADLVRLSGIFEGKQTLDASKGLRDVTMLIFGYDQRDQLGTLANFPDALVNRNIIFQKTIFLGEFKALLGSIDVKDSDFDIFAWLLELRWQMLVKSITSHLLDAKGSLDKVIYGEGDDPMVRIHALNLCLHNITDFHATIINAGAFNNARLHSKHWHLVKIIELLDLEILNLVSDLELLRGHCFILLVAFFLA